MLTKIQYSGYHAGDVTTMHDVVQISKKNGVNVVFKVIKKDREIDGNCYETYQLEKEDEIK